MNRLAEAVEDMTEIAEVVDRKERRISEKPEEKRQLSFRKGPL